MPATRGRLGVSDSKEFSGTILNKAGIKSEHKNVNKAQMALENTVTFNTLSRLKDNHNWILERKNYIETFSGQVVKPEHTVY